jgi:hypothetical protein
MGKTSQNHRKWGETMNVRLKVNVIADGKNYPRDSVIDDVMLPDRLKTEEYIAYDLENTEGRSCSWAI